MIRTLLVVLLIWFVFVTFSNWLYVYGETMLTLKRRDYLRKKYRNSETIPEEDAEKMNVRYSFTIVAAINKLKEAYSYMIKERELP